MSALKKRREKGEERGFRAYFLRLFGKYDIRNEEQFIFFGKWLIFIVLVFVEISVAFNHLINFEERGGFPMLFAIIALESSLTVSVGLKLFVVKNARLRAALYAVDAIAAGGFTVVAQGASPIALYILVLTEFYIGAERTRPSVIVLCAASAIYATSYVLQAYLRYDGAVDLAALLSQSFSSLFTLVIHFIVVQVALAFYRQFLRLDKALKELDESKKELEKAYAVVAEVTALEERQRIAKDIHDTAGHSLTTVIMQTEAAKLIIDNNPEEAKQKIVAANLQAKHALEELRDSVHLLSGVKENGTLKAALEGIIHESTDGTGLTIRSEIAQVRLSPAKSRFLCNTLKEGVSNGLRHGGATAFWFELKEEDGKIRFLLSDNGKGVQTDKLTLGFGLTGMRERVKSLGGEIEFITEEGEGFEIQLSLPADKED